MNRVNSYVQGLKEIKSSPAPFNLSSINNEEFRRRAQQFEEETFLYESQQFVSEIAEGSDGGDPKLPNIPTLTPTYLLVFSQLTANEGDFGLGVALYTTNVSNNTTIPYTITGISSEDIDVPLTGSFVVNSNYADLGFSVSEDFLTEGTETMFITLDGITPTVSAALVINDSSTTPVPAYNLSIINSNSNIITQIDEGNDEGNTVPYVYLETINVPPFSNIPYTITGISQEDIDIPLTGNISLEGGDWGIIQFNVLNDELTEGSETMVVTLDGITPTVSAALLINDTSTTPIPTYNLYFTDGSNNPQLTANETDPIYGDDNYRILSLETTNIPEGTQIPYTITGVSQEDILNDVPLTGSITIQYGGYGGFGIYFAEDFLTEGPETMIATLDGITPTVSAALLINDTSTTPE